MYFVMVIVDVRVVSSATANKGRSAVATIVLRCIATSALRRLRDGFPFFLSFSCIYRYWRDATYALQSSIDVGGRVCDAIGGLVVGLVENVGDEYSVFRMQVGTVIVVRRFVES